MTQAPQKIKVFIATGDAGQVHDLTALLNAEEDVEVVGLAADARDALAALAAARTDVVVVDLHLPDADGIAATEAITAQFPWVSPILVSSNADPNVLRRAMLAGPRHFLIRPFPAQDLLDAVREVFVRD